MFDREIDHYNVILYDFVSAIGGYRYFKTVEFYTEEKAVEYARGKLAEGFKIRIEQVDNIIGWWF